LKIYSAIKKNINLNSEKAVMLLYLQLALIILLLTTLILIYGVDTGSRLVLYLALLIVLLTILGISLLLNLIGKYKISLGLTIFCLLLGPWSSILLDKTVISGDLLPLVYIALTIYIYAMFLSARTTIIITTLQIFLLIILINSNQMLLNRNWPSLISFIIFSSVIAIVYNFIGRKQMKIIVEQKNKLFNEEAKMRLLSIQDPLTGLFNRRYMDEVFKKEISNIEKANKSLGVIIADVDNFKIINDTYGHTFGDSVLVEISKIITSNIREQDISCRFGGDEFILILPDCSLENSYKKAEKLRNAINNSIIKNDKNELISVNLSFGLATFPENGILIEDVLMAADKALYMAKKNGKNSIFTFKNIEHLKNIF